MKPCQVQDVGGIGGPARRVTAEGRCEEDDPSPARRGERGERPFAPLRLLGRVEELVHARSAGGDDRRLGQAEGLGVERHLVRRADDGVGVVPVDGRERARPPRLSNAAVPDGLEGAPGMPELDDAHVGVRIELVDHGLVVVEQDHVGASQEPRQPHAVGHAAAGAHARLEDGAQLVPTVQAPLDHPVMHELEVPAQLGPRVGSEHDQALVARQQAHESHGGAKRSHADGVLEPVPHRARCEGARRAFGLEDVNPHVEDAVRRHGRDPEGPRDSDELALGIGLREGRRGAGHARPHPRHVERRPSGATAQRPAACGSVRRRR